MSEMFYGLNTYVAIGYHSGQINIEALYIR